MSPRPPLPPGPYLVLGLARSGRAAALALRARGLEVSGADSGEPDRAELEALGVRVHAHADGVALLSAARTVIKSPGVPAEAPAVRAARERGLAVIGELELGWRLLEHDFVAVTGTNGKTTTVELLGHIHRTAGLAVAVAGNVGRPLSALAADPGRPLAADTTVVCEASSFQLEDTERFAPDAAVLLNLAPDHLDRHGSFEEYTRAKLRIFAGQGNDDVAVAPSALELEDLGGCARRVCFGSRPDDELADRGGKLWWDGHVLVGHDELALRGAHNRLNAMAAAAVALARGVPADAVADALRTFPGVPHRLEEVARRGGVLYVNDSKATNVASTVVALQAFPASRVILILGGQGKGQDFAPLREPVARTARAVALIGEDAEGLAAALEGSGAALRRAGDLAGAVRWAAREARDGDVVLLSPACASFDQFADFEARGDAFRELVGEL